MIDLRADFFDVLRDLHAEPSTPISLLDVGSPLVAKGHEQQQIVDLLFGLVHEGTIRLLKGNRLELTKPQ